MINYLNCLSEFNTSVALDIEGLPNSVIKDELNKIINNSDSSESIKYNVELKPYECTNLKISVLPDELLDNTHEVNEYINEYRQYFLRNRILAYVPQEKLYDLENICNDLEKCANGYGFDYNKFKSEININFYSYDNFYYITDETLLNLFKNQISKDGYVIYNENSINDLKTNKTNGDNINAYMCNTRMPVKNVTKKLEKKDIDAINKTCTDVNKGSSICYSCTIPEILREYDNTGIIYTPNYDHDPIDVAFVKEWKKQRLKYNEKCTITDIINIVNKIKLAYKKIFQKIVFSQTSN